MAETTWRQRAAPIIERVLRETKGQDAKKISAALRDAYPFGQRDSHPYKIWCNEIQRQRQRAGHYPARSSRAAHPDPDAERLQVAMEI